jgi:hypothetical protein
MPLACEDLDAPAGKPRATDRVLHLRDDTAHRPTGSVIGLVMV